MYRDEKICKMELGSNYYLHLFFSQSTLFFNAFLESVHVCVCVCNSFITSPKCGPNRNFGNVLQTSTQQQREIPIECKAVIFCSEPASPLVGTLHAF